MTEHYKSEHLFTSEGGHDLVVRVATDGYLILKQGNDTMVLSPEDLRNLNAVAPSTAPAPCVDMRGVFANASNTHRWPS